MQNDSSIIYVLTNAKSSTMTKRGIIENHRIYFNKADIATGQILFKIKIKFFSTKMLDGYANIIGISNTHSFITMSANRFYIIDNTTGTIILNHKKLIKSNPALKGLQTSNIKFDEGKQTILLFDNAGYGYYFDAAKKNLEKINTDSNIQKSNNTPNQFKAIDSYGVTKLAMPEWHDTIHEDMRIHTSSKKIIHTVEKPGTKRKFIVYSNPTEKIDSHLLKNDFLHPQVIESGREKNAFVSGNNFLVLHVKNESPKPEDFLISCVTENSTSIWTSPLTDCFEEIKIGKSAILYFEQINNITYFISYLEHTESNKLFVAKVDLKSGANSTSNSITIKF